MSIKWNFCLIKFHQGLLERKTFYKNELHQVIYTSLSLFGQIVFHDDDIYTDKFKFAKKSEKIEYGNLTFFENTLKFWICSIMPWNCVAL